MKNSFVILFSLLLLSCRDYKKQQSGEQSEAPGKVEILASASIEEIYTELKLRIDSKNAPVQVDTVPPYFSVNAKFNSFSKNDLVESINKKQIDLLKKIDGALYYGKDDRIDLFNVKDPMIFKNCIATCCLVNSSDVKSNGNVFELNCSSTGLCPNENFYGQKKLAICSAFAIAPDIIITAGHCINNDNYNDYVVLYGFNIQSSNQITPNSTGKENVYKIKKLLINNAEKDFSVIKIDRPVPKNMIIPIRRSGKIRDETKLYVAGYPDGLPLKIAMNGKIRNNRNPLFFLTNLDTYHGNSGSPVFDSLTNKVEGILVRGKQDYEVFIPCKKSFICGDLDCRGEDVIRITELLPAIEKYLPK